MTRRLKVLFYIEPVIFRQRPGLLRPHADWCAWIVGNNTTAPIDFYIATNAFLIEYIDKSQPRLAREGYLHTIALDPNFFLAAFGFDRASYARSLYEETELERLDVHAVGDSLAHLDSLIDPDIVIATAQNLPLTKVFSDKATLFIEQAPLPRIGRTTLRMMLDPCGHQAGCLLTKRNADVRTFIKDDKLQEALLAAWDAAAAAAPGPRHDVRKLLGTRADGRRIALLALQPPDWLSYEGAGVRQAPEDLLAAWLTALPDGWIGVPTYHSDYQLPLECEAALSQLFPNLAVLPRMLSVASSEALLPAADALVTASSTAAATAAICGKRVVVTARSAFDWLSNGDLTSLNEHQTLSRAERASLLGFLCHRFSHAQDELLGGSNYFFHLAESILSYQQKEEYWLDPSDFNLERALRLINPD